MNPNTNIPVVDHQEEITSSEVVAPRDQTSIAPTSQILGGTKLAEMIPPPDSVTHKVVVDDTLLPDEVSPTKISI